MKEISREDSVAAKKARRELEEKKGGCGLAAERRSSSAP